MFCNGAPQINSYYALFHIFDRFNTVKMIIREEYSIYSLRRRIFANLEDNSAVIDLDVQVEWDSFNFIWLEAMLIMSRFNLRVF